MGINLLSILTQKTTDMNDLVLSIQKIAELQNSQQTEWSVNGAAFIVTAVFCILILGGVFGLLIRSILNQQKQLTSKILDGNDLIVKFQESFDKNTEILEKVSYLLKKSEELDREKAKREIAKEQLNCIVKNSLNSSKFYIISSIWKIIEQNNIRDTEKTKIKVNNVINNLYNNFNSGLNNFDYKGTELGSQIKIIQESWKDKEAQLMIDFIYSTERDSVRLNNELDILFETFLNEIRQELIL